FRVLATMAFRLRGALAAIAPLIMAVVTPGCGASSAEEPLHGIGTSDELAHAPATGSALESDGGAPIVRAPVSAGDASVPEYVALASQGRVVPPRVDVVENMCALLASCPSLPLPAESL